MTKSIFFHHDADGVMSAYMTHFAYPDAELKSVETFGDCSSWKDGDIMVDMRPKDPSIKGLVIDHHPGHEPIGVRGYDLIFDHKPASLICWEQFRDKIPQKEWWKVVIGIVGDGQPEKIPYEIWDSCKSLRKNYSTFMNKYKGTWSTGFYPIYQSLSSPINAFCRCGKYEMCFDIIENAEHPLDIIKHPEVVNQKKKNNTSFNGSMYGSQVLELPNLEIILFKSPNLRITGWVASVLGNDRDGITRIAIDETNGSLSVRGDLANYIKGVCEHNGLDYIHFDGHDGFMGGHISGDPKRLYYDLMDIL